MSVETSISPNGELLCVLLREMAITPILADIGCSGDRQPQWDPIAKVSVLIGFDPDSREIRDDRSGKYQRSIVMPRAVCGDDAASDIQFFLTKNPYCSSVLEPDLDSLVNYSTIREFFITERCATVPATSLNRVIEELKIQSIDWIKVDSQGTDLRIIQSLSSDALASLLALDIEPGVIDAYRAEDLFTDTHRFLHGSGFWMSSMHHQMYPRIRKEGLQLIADLSGLSRDALAARLPRSPTCIEGRYFKTLEKLLADNAAERSFVLCFVFAMLDGKIGFAADLCIGYETRYGRIAVGQLMREIIAQAIVEAPSRGELPNQKNCLRVSARKWLRRLARFSR
jgi:Methyltransferase FkbM domain